MKVLCLGDIHGRTIWKDILEKENPDKVIFLGDYITSHEGISSEKQISNLEEILKYKEEHSSSTVLLRGNHCMQHLGYYWAECSDLDNKVFSYMSENSFRKRFLNLTQWVYIDNKIIFSHAGISQVWLDEYAKLDDVNKINDLEPSEIFGFIPNSICDFTGTSITQSPMWIRPYTLQRCNVIGFDQVVGHTTQKAISKISKSTKGGQTIWLCDTLEKGQYLIIEDGIFKTGKIFLNE